jgi:hypothetical protein
VSKTKKRIFKVCPKGCPNCHTAWLVFEKIDSDTERCPRCGCLILHVTEIKVIKVPAGPAPEKIREAWVGLNLPARRTILKGPVTDFLTDKGDMIFRGESYMVPVEFALEILEKKSPEAAQWFRINCPPWMKHLTFGINEVKVVKEYCIYDMP